MAAPVVEQLAGGVPRNLLYLNFSLLSTSLQTLQFLSPAPLSSSRKAAGAAGGERRAHARLDLDEEQPVRACCCPLRRRRRLAASTSGSWEQAWLR